MQWQHLLSSTRFSAKNGVPHAISTAKNKHDLLRTAFHIDTDRIVFCAAFRRLGRKTQVHPLAKHDHTHNRLTHSVEVSSVGRSLGNLVGFMLKLGGFLPPNNTPSDIGSLVQAACLAHDIGNPPFGHVGENALREWFALPENIHYLKHLSDNERLDITHYEGNAHSLRLCLTKEMYCHDGGLRLSAATLGALMKYPWSSSRYSQKFSIYQSEWLMIEAIADELGLSREGANGFVRHPLSYLMEAADDICYALLDLEDALEIGMIAADEVERILSPLAEGVETWPVSSAKQRCAMLRGTAIGNAVNDIAQTFMQHHRDLLHGQFAGHDLISVASNATRETLQAAKTFAQAKIFRHQSKVVTEIAAFPCLGQILGLLIPAADALCSAKPLTTRQKLALQLLSDDPILPTDTHYAAFMKVLDYVGALTDNSAARLSQDISGAFLVC